MDKMLFILSNLEKRIKGCTENERSQDKLKRCQDELSDQGILDILICILEMLYYKSVPPTMFQKAFKDKQSDHNQKKKSTHETEGIDLKTIRVHEYQA